MITKPVQFHWRLLQGGETQGWTRARQLELKPVGLPDVKAQAEFCELAEKAGASSLLVDISYGKPDPLLLASGIAPFTKKISFLVAVRSGLITPTYFVKQVNTFSALYPGRILLNVVAGHSPVEQGYYGDFLSHDERYARTEEFLRICHAFWRGDIPVDFTGEYFKIEQGNLHTPFVAPERKHPYIFIAGGSDASRNLAISQGDCWMRLAARPEEIAEAGKPVLDAGKDVGLRMSAIVRSTRAEAIKAAEALIHNLDPEIREKKKEHKFVRHSDSVSFKQVYQQAEQEWLTPWLWNGAVRAYGAPAIAFVGTPNEIAQAIMAYKEAGVSQYILSGWPKTEEMVRFGKEVLPIVRKMERSLSVSGVSS